MKPSLYIRFLLLKLVKYFRRLLIVLGSILLFAVLLSFTSYPYWACYWLGVHNSDIKGNPDVIILLGGGGMPSPDGLIRAYYTAQSGIEFPEALIYIAMPHDTALHSESPEYLLAHELLIRGIDSSRIHYEPDGNNTRAQAVNIFKMLGSNSADTIILRIVTSPEHMYRSVATFRKAGFKNVGGMASFDEAITERLLLGEHGLNLETSRLNIRYNMWNYLKYEISAVREYCAIAYYKCRGWM
jgi:uncharacterized SAM-binding protein YcdF (DUF218 family)